MTNMLLKTKADHRKMRAVMAEMTVAQTMTPNAGALTAITRNVAMAAVNFALSAPVGTSRFSVAAGTLPAGLALSGAGALTGTATTAGNYSFSVRGTDEFGNTKVNAYTLTVNA